MLQHVSDVSARDAAPISYTTQRALRTLELLSFSPASAPTLARALGVHPRTARRTLKTLVADQYLGRSPGPRVVYRPTVRLLALSAQLGARLPLVVQGREVVAHLAASADCGAALVVPSYSDVLVLASAGRDAPAAGSLVPAHKSGAGRLLLRHRPAWRTSLGWTMDQLSALTTEQAAAVLPAQPEPIAAIELHLRWHPDSVLRTVLADACADLASRLAE